MSADERANDIEGPFSIGSDVWPGIAKLIEACAEVVQVCAKLISTGGRTDHWSGDDLSERLAEEIGDLRAAIQYVHAHNTYSRLDWAMVQRRTDDKFSLYQVWDGKGRR